MEILLIIVILIIAFLIPKANNLGSVANPNSSGCAFIAILAVVVILVLVVLSGTTISLLGL